MTKNVTNYTNYNAKVINSSDYIIVSGHKPKLYQFFEDAQGNHEFRELAEVKE